ncbi:MAG: radical SAM protein [Nanoarchaeota archaeon]|nr:radical SAM protein [Nanoarchaeota archaeon]
MVKKSVVIIELNSCKNSCLFCNPKGIRRTIGFKEMKQIEVHLLKQVNDLKRRGFKEVEISGCDPIEYDKITGFIKWLKKNSFKQVMLSTHGRDLHNIELVNEFKKAGLDQLRIPLYGSNAKIHDSVTQCKGSFKETLNGIRNIQKYAPGINILITSLIMKQNYKDIANIFSLAANYSSDISFSLACLKDDAKELDIGIHFDKIKPYLISLLELSEKSNAQLNIIDIPFCIFGFYRKNIINISGPPVTARIYSIPEEFKSNVQNLPSYRIKRKLNICSRCNLRDRCDGFFHQYTKLFDLSYLKPL